MLDEARTERLAAGAAHLLEPGETVSTALFGGAATKGFGRRISVVLTDRNLYLMALGQMGSKSKEVLEKHPLAAAPDIRRTRTVLYIGPHTLRLGTMHLRAADELIAGVAAARETGAPGAV